MNTADAVRAIYPRLPDILDEESLAALATLESAERAFATRQGTPLTQYLRALLLKAVAHLGHSNFSVGQLPRQMRLRIAHELGFPDALADIRSVKGDTRRNLNRDVRSFLGLRPYMSLSYALHQIPIAVFLTTVDPAWLLRASVSGARSAAGVEARMAASTIQGGCRDRARRTGFISQARPALLPG